MTATETCPVEDCPAGFRHWHSKTSVAIHQCLQSEFNHTCDANPRCCEPRSQVEPSRTLRIEVTDDDVIACANEAGTSYVRMREALSVFAERLGRRQWVEVPTDATIPDGMPTRHESLRIADGAFEAREWTTRGTIRPAERQRGAFFVPADRVADLIVPDPPKDLAERLIDRLDADGWEVDNDGSLLSLRAALAAEGVEA